MLSIEQWKIVFGLIGIVIGAILTGTIAWLLKRKEKSNNIIENAVTEISNLATDWYHQLDKIHRALIDNAPVDEILKLVTDYRQSRLLLPKIMRHISLLNSVKKCHSFVRAANRFLHTVTEIEAITNDTHDDSPGKTLYSCISPASFEYVRICSINGDSSFSNYHSEKQTLDKLLRKVDAHVQEINVLAGIVQRKL